MPIYEYECTNCGKITEEIQKFSDAPFTKCKSCSGKLHKLISHSSFHLKGSGWYVTDYANKTDQNSSSSEGVKTEKKSAEPKKTPDKSTKINA